MVKKILLIASLVLIVFFILAGCSNQENTITDEVAIERQLISWGEVWQSKNVDNFISTMVDDGINFTVVNELDQIELSRNELTIDEFINFVTAGELADTWNAVTESLIIISTTNVSNNLAVVYGEWKFGKVSVGYIVPFEIHFINENGVWLIYDITLGASTSYYKGEENEPFDPHRHNAYVSFNVDGEPHIFHDHYGGVSPEMSSICTYNNSFSIDTYKYETGERIILDFIWEGVGAGTSSFWPIRWSSTSDSNSD